MTNKTKDYIECEYLDDGSGEKPKGWLTWISKLDAVKANVNVYQTLLKEPILDKEGDWLAQINKDSVYTYQNALVDKSLLKMAPETQVQVEREG